MSSAQAMERYYTTNMSYLNAALPVCQGEVAQFYVFRLFRWCQRRLSRRSQMTPQGAQANDACGVLNGGSTGAENA